MFKQPPILVVLGASLAMAGCGRGTHGKGGSAEQQTAPDAGKMLAERWRRMFADPAAVISAANDFGYKAGPWRLAALPPGYRADGIEQVLPDARSPVRVMTRFAATGQARVVDAIEFRFVVAKTGPAETKKARDAVNIPRRIVAGFLSRFGLSPNDDIRSVLLSGGSATMTQGGGRIVVDSGRPADGMVVTITRA